MTHSALSSQLSSLDPAWRIAFPLSPAYFPFRPCPPQHIQVLSSWLFFLAAIYDWPGSSMELHIPLFSFCYRLFFLFSIIKILVSSPLCLLPLKIPPSPARICIIAPMIGVLSFKVLFARRLMSPLFFHVALCGNHKYKFVPFPCSRFLCPDPIFWEEVPLR